MRKIPQKNKQKFGASRETCSGGKDSGKKENNSFSPFETNTKRETTLINGGKDETPLMRVVSLQTSAKSTRKKSEKRKQRLTKKRTFF